MSDNIRSQLTSDIFKKISVARAIGVILLISSLAFLFLVWLIYIREPGEVSSGDWVTRLPTLNALLNSTSTVFIILGFIEIKRRQYVRHMKLMLTAFVTSCLFFISYLIYHNFAGDTLFPGEGLIRPIYFTILISHIVLSAFVLPMVLASFYFAWSGAFRIHRKLSRWTLPIWLYVSVTGVVIYFILNMYV